MAGNVASPTSVAMLWLWVIGVVILGIIIAYGVIKAGRLSRAERERLDHNTVATQTHEDPVKRRDAGRRS
jgi:hypothetical protein